MKSFKDKVAVITGAASGIGFGLAEKAAQEQMKIVLADVEEEKLSIAEEKLSNYGIRTLAVNTDVSSNSSVEKLAKETIDTFDEIHLLFNNAGVGITGPKLWEYTIDDWNWILGVNLWGVIHGINSFIPIMLKQNSEAHVVNTASSAGLLSPAGIGPYNVSKHSVVTISETLHNELRAMKSKIHVSVLCPGLVNTNITKADRNRPNSLQNRPNFEMKRTDQLKSLTDMMERSIKKGITNTEVAEMVYNAIIEEKFYILTHNWIKERFQVRSEKILTNSNPIDNFW
ncbi:MAG: SDR family NAD(P)-dependent oxidoreductase [Candidatus Hodarchaeales archaeon]|jgi:NAD(P)-dependent dehydrogenase (short-subunit alcohol dehydrogenase family)